jgi:hypothetical protein
MPAAFSLFIARWHYQLNRRAFITEDRGQHPDGRPFSYSPNSISEFAGEFLS